MAKSGTRPTTAAPGERSAPTRAALVSAAIKALIDVGYSGASARDIAQRAGCNQALVFYHFGSVPDLLLAALDDVSVRRLAAYEQQVAEAGTLTELIDAAQHIFSQDLDTGHVTVLVEMITAAQSVPGFGAQVATRLAPWREFAAAAIAARLADSPLGSLVPAREAAYAVVAGFLGLDLLVTLDGDRASALALFDRVRTIAGLLDLAGPFGVATGRPGRPS